MRLGRIALLWVVALLLGLLYRAEERRAAAPAPADATRPGARLVDVSPADVVAVRLVDGDEVIRLERRDAGWEVAGPAAATVPADLARAFVESLLDAVVLQTMPPAERSDAAFGLDPRQRIEVETAEGAPRTFVLGGQTPTGTAAYVRDASGAVRVIGRNALVYRKLLLDAARPHREPDVPTGPVAREPLTGRGRPG
jgi:hypothetical protein